MKRERSVKEIISLLAQWVDRAENQVDYDEEYQKELRELLRMVEEADREEVEKIKEEMDFEELEQQCEKVYQDAEKAKKALESGETERVEEYLKEILKLEKNIYSKIETYDLGERYSKGEFIGDGRNAEVFELKEHEDKVIKILTKAWGDPEGIIQGFKKYMEVEKQLPDEAQIARIRAIGFYEGDAAVVMDKAPGREVHWEPDSVKGEVSDEEWYQNWSRMNSLMADAPHSHYVRLRKDVKLLRMHNIKIDPKSDNFYYHPEHGFTLMDLGKDDLARGRDKEGRYQPDLLSSIARPGFASRFIEHVQPEDVRNIQKIEEHIDKIGNPASKGEVKDRTKSSIRRLEEEILE